MRTTTAKLEKTKTNPRWRRIIHSRKHTKEEVRWRYSSRH